MAEHTKRKLTSKEKAELDFPNKTAVDNWLLKKDYIVIALLIMIFILADKQRTGLIRGTAITIIAITLLYRNMYNKIKTKMKGEKKWDS